GGRGDPGQRLDARSVRSPLRRHATAPTRQPEQELMARSWMCAVGLLAAAAVSSTCALAQTRAVTPGWQEVTINKEGGAVAVQSRIDSDVVALKLSGGQVEVRRTDIPIFAVDKVDLSLDHMALTDAARGKGADVALAAYRDFVTADLVKRGWKEATAERAKI